jgi:hypothetical protein
MAPANPASCGFLFHIRFNSRAAFLATSERRFLPVARLADHANYGKPPGVESMLPSERKNNGQGIRSTANRRRRETSVNGRSPKTPLGLFDFPTASKQIPQYCDGPNRTRDTKAPPAGMAIRS